MNNKEKLKKLCTDAEKEKISPKLFYGGLKEISEAEPDSDLACLAEDAMMDLEMDGSTKAAKEAAQNIMEELNGHF